MRRTPPAAGASPHSGALAARASAVAPPASRRPAPPARRERPGLDRSGRRSGRDRRCWSWPTRALGVRLRPVGLARCSAASRPFAPAGSTTLMVGVNTVLGSPVDGRDPAAGHDGRPGGVAALAAPGRLPWQRRRGRAGRLPARHLLALATTRWGQDHRELGRLLVPLAAGGRAGGHAGGHGLCAAAAGPAAVIGASGRRAPSLAAVRACPDVPGRRPSHRHAGRGHPGRGGSRSWRSASSHPTRCSR